MHSIGPVSVLRLILRDHLERMSLEGAGMNQAGLLGFSSP